MILELFEALQKYKFKNKIRLAWWGAEENGLVRSSPKSRLETLLTSVTFKVGSRYYVSKLTTKEIDSLLAYINFDMVSRGFYGVFDGDGSDVTPAGPPGSEIIEKLFLDHFASKGYPVTPAALNGGSDYVAFMSVLKKPVGGLFTGTGVDQDDCYHQACDTYSNANSTLLEINAKVNNTTSHTNSFSLRLIHHHCFESTLANFSLSEQAAAHVLSILAQDGKKLLGKIPASVALRDVIERRDPHTGNVMREAPFYQWPELDGLKHTATCAGGLH